MNKKKKALVVYFKNGDFQNEIKKEIIYEEMLRNFVKEGREVIRVVNYDGAKIASFNDGSSITIRTAFGKTKGERFTHLYVDENIDKLGLNIETFIRESHPMLAQGTYDNWDLDGDRIFTYEVSDKVNIKPYK